jgi:aminoglycoside 3-N-acetyltransferase
MLLDEAQATSALTGLLSELGVSRGDVIYLGCDMGRIPLPNYSAALNRSAIREREQRWCEFLFRHLMDSIGPGGTLLVPTFSYNYAARNEPYRHETTVSETGPFTEYVRQRPDAIRSLHPIHSVAGIGKHAQEILDGVGRAAYGAMSAFGRLSRFDASFVCLGTTIGNSLTYVHHLEQVYGSNHRYNKAFTVPVFRNGVEVAGPWLGYVRFLGVAARPKIENIEKELRAEGCLREVSQHDQPNQRVHISDVDRVGFAMLSRDPCAFLPAPIYVSIDEVATSGFPSAGPEVRFKLTF